MSLFLLLFTFLVQAQTSSVSSNMGMDPEQSILKNTESSENHKTLLAAMRAADLEEVLGYDGPFTVFAPSDRAFEKLSDEKIAELLKPCE